jgi:endoglucanase
MNNASDGDVLIAWALAEAAELWADAAHRAAGRRIAVEIGRKLVLFKTGEGAVLLPGVAGFSAQERPDGPVVNLSYYVFPAFARLGVVAPEIDWAGLARTGLDQLRAARFGPAELPTDWISLRDGAPRPADGFPPAILLQCDPHSALSRLCGSGRVGALPPLPRMGGGATFALHRGREERASGRAAG